MAFVHRTTRDKEPPGSRRVQTSAVVGPGAYLPSSSFGPERPNYAPFASTSSRENASPPRLHTPGPGTYAYQSPQSTRHHGESAFRSRTARFNRRSGNDAPGPGQYSTHREWTRRRRVPPPRSAQSSGPALGAVNWVRVPTAPSIPAAHQSFGYEEGRNGELVMQKDTRDVYTGPGTVGPGAYDVTAAEVARLERARGRNIFGRDRTTRTDFAKQAKDAPGPGQYSAPPPPTPGSQSFNARRPTSVFASTAERDRKPASPEQVQAPGPGSYSLPTAFQRQTVPENRQYFGSTVRRFADASAAGSSGAAASAPGPGAYASDKVSSFRTPGGVDVVAALGGAGTASPPAARARKVPFGASSSRFDSREATMAASTPGVGAYQSEGFADQIQRRLTSRKSVFGSSSTRVGDERRSRRDAAQQRASVGSLSSASGGLETDVPVRRPVGGNAGGARVPAVHSLNKPSSSFASSGGRFKQWGKRDGDEAPPPGHYNVQVKWGRGRHGLLRGTSQRFRDKVVDTPAPGQYYSGTEKLARRGVAAITGHAGNPLVARSERFRAASPDTSPLGPGSYDTDYLYGNLNRPTFNITIAEDSAL